MKTDTTLISLNSLPSQKWLMVSFECTNGWNGVITSIPATEKDNAIKYLERQGFQNIQNLIIK